MISERFSVIFILMMLSNPTEALDTQATRVTTESLEQGKACPQNPASARVLFSRFCSKRYE